MCPRATSCGSWPKPLRRPGKPTWCLICRTNTPTGTYTFTLPKEIQATHARVLYENRELPIELTGLTDSFTAEYQYPIYRITP